ncbi:MAG: hypothetical protein JXR82_01040, partial [Marinifilaceae bacterium]|nr:hypothetical protein [Marinifilaceae bacterium]
LVAGSKYEVTMLVASAIPAEPSPWANNAITQNEKNRVNTDFNILTFAIIICFCASWLKEPEKRFLLFFEFSPGEVAKPLE